MPDTVAPAMKRRTVVSRNSKPAKFCGPLSLVLFVLEHENVRTVRTRRVVVRFLHRTEYPSSTSSLICLIGMIFDATVGCFEKRDVTLSRSTANRQTSVIKMTEMRTTRLVFLLD